MRPSVIIKAGLFVVVLLITAAGAAWRVHSESERMTYYDLDFDGRPVGYVAGLEDWLASGDGAHDVYRVLKYLGSWVTYTHFGPGVDYGGFDVTETGDGACCFVAPPYTGDGNWDAEIYRFKGHGTAEELVGAPRMRIICAFALSSFDDIWFAGLSYESETQGSRIIAHFDRDGWTVSKDPTQNGLGAMHFFAPDNGWGCEGNRIYRYNGTTWYAAGVVPGADWLGGCDFKSPTDIWAAGNNNTGGKVVHYQNGVWREIFTPGPLLFVSDVAMWDEYNGWAVGYLTEGYQHYGRIWQCRDGDWSPCICPTEGALRHVEVVSKYDAWAAGGHTLIRYETEVDIAPASFGRIKAAYAGGAPGAGALLRPGAGVKTADRPPLATFGRKPAPPDVPAASEALSD